MAEYRYALDMIVDTQTPVRIKSSNHCPIFWNFIKAEPGTNGWVVVDDPHEHIPCEAFKAGNSVNFAFSFFGIRTGQFALKSIESAQLTFKKSTNPFGGGTTQVLQMQSGGESAAFSGTQQGFYSRPIPFVTKNCEARYSFGVQVTVTTQGGDTLIFDSDPEMVVGPGG